MKYKFRYKFISFMALACLAVVGLASCSHTKVNKSIEGDAVYAKSGEYVVTNKQLWDELKWNSYDTINEKIGDAIMQDELKTANAAISYVKGETPSEEITNSALKRYLDEFEGIVFNEIYGVNKIEKLEKFTEKEIKTKAQTYVDNIYISEGVQFDVTSFELSQLQAKKKVMFAGTKYETEYYLYDTYEFYAQSVARKIFSYKRLAEDIEDHNDDADNDDQLYYTDADVLQHQKEKYQYSADRQAVIIRFTNDDEVKATLKAFGLKVYENAFYYIPTNGKTTVEYSKYYDEFNIEDIHNSAYCINLSALGGDALIFELYLQIYNYIYNFRDALPTSVNIVNDTTNRRNITEAVVAKFANDDTDPSTTVNAWSAEYKDVLNKTQDDLDDIDVDFKLYVNKTLKVDPDLSKKESRYSTSGKSYGNYYYMVFKVSEDPLKDWYWISDNGDEKIFNESHAKIDSKYADYKAELIEEMMWDELIDTKIDNYIQEARDKAKIYIYDNDIEILYSSKKQGYSKTHKDAPSKNTLFTVVSNKKKVNYSVNDIFDELEKASGVTTAVDLLSRQAIKKTQEYADTNKDRKEYKTSIELLLSYFANGGLSGYSSSLGKYNFLKLYFHTTDINEIIDNTYRVSDASAKILTNYASNDAFYDLLQSYAKSSYDKSFTSTAKRVLVYVDMDEDGVEDTDFDWSTTVKGTTQTYKDVAVELLNKIITRLENSTDPDATLTDLITEIQKCQRFTNGIDEWTGSNTEYDPTEPESRWAKYKRAGLYISSQEYASVGISTQESSTDSSVPSDIVKERIKDLYAAIKQFDTFPGVYVDDADYRGASPAGFMDGDKGYALLVVTSCSKKSSAEFKPTDDANRRFQDIVIEYDDVIKNISNIYNDSKSEATKDQIILFVYEYLNYSTSEFFPASVQAYITDYIMPVYQRYTDSTTQRELLFDKMLGSTIDFVANPENNAKLAETMAINKRVADGYLSDTDEANLFVGWWDIIKTL